jgi:hypothetical protein
VRMVASLVPKDFNMNLNDDGLTELSDEQLVRRLKVLSEQASDLLEELDVEPDHTVN